MMMHRQQLLKLFMCVGLVVVGFGSAPSAADSVSGLITRTYVIVEDTDLTGDVTCDVTGRHVSRLVPRASSLRSQRLHHHGQSGPVTG